MPYFDDVEVRSLSYLNTLFQRDNQDKAKFYKGLPQIIKRLPARINLQRILPCLIKEFINPTMIPFVLPNVFIIAEISSSEEYKNYIFPHLKSIMNLQEPVQILLIFMQNMETLLKLTSSENVKLYVLPMVFKALESNSMQIQELCLAILPSFAKLIDYPSMKNSLLPRIKNLCIKTGIPSVRVNCLLCIGQLLPHLDKWVVLDDILMFLPTIIPREPAVIMAIIGIYKVASQYETLGIPKEFIANKVLPFLWPLSIENGLLLQQYNTIMLLIHELSKKVETEHIRKLEQLNTSDNSLPFDTNTVLAPTKKTDETEADTIYTDLHKSMSIDSHHSKKINASVPIASKPTTTASFTFCASLPTSESTPFEQYVPQQKQPMFNSYSTGSTLYGNLVSQPSVNNANSVTSNNSTSVLQPLNVYRSNATSSQSSTILTKEDILEFLK